MVKSNRARDNNVKIAMPSAIEPSVNGSTVRAKILLFLDKAGEAPLSDIVDGIGVCYANVHGAMKGRKGHYSSTRSLTDMDFVEKRQVAGGLILFSLTDRGRNTVRILKTEGG